MPELILHHYPLSPFSEKIRAMLGYSNLSWYSVLTQEMPPRPQLARLAGGYRKIPVAQIGADIFCDTRTITREIARLSGNPALCMDNCSQEIKEYISEVDLEIFLACVVSSGSWSLVQKAIASTSLAGALKILGDRIGLARKSKVSFVSPRQAKKRVQQHLNDLEDRLSKDFIFGNEPSIADFSTYHGLWMIREVGELKLVNRHPKTIAWMERIKAMGHGTPTEISADEAISIAKNAVPRPITDIGKHAELGCEIRVAPSDYGRNYTEGKLIAFTQAEWVLERRSPETKTLHLHFPREGFEQK